MNTLKNFLPLATALAIAAGYAAMTNGWPGFFGAATATAVVLASSIFVVKYQKAT